MFEIEGIIAAIATPMFENGEINEKEIQNQVNRQIKAGVNALFCLGTNGEFYCLTEKEKLKVIELVVKATNRRVPVFAGTGCNSTRETIELSQKAIELGADALSIITPSFALLNQDELYQYYADIASKVEVPIVMYNIPARTGNSLSPKIVKQLAKDYPNIKGIKDSSGNFNLILQYLQSTQGMEFSVLSGNDALILWTLLAGGKGGITAIANIFPERMVKIYEYFKSGDLERAKEMQNSIAPIRECLQLGNPNSIVKKAAQLIGQNVGPCRAPYGMISDELSQKILEVLKTHYSNDLQ